jgi:NADH dehydrogenase/NADH:ubiquinone oxidoreductase subunit G
MTVQVKINGAAFTAETGEYILAVARRNRIPIPSICHHDGLPGLACCRLCVVEVDEGGGGKVVVSCVYPLSRDCEVLTESERIQGIRRTILSMLRDRAPGDKRIKSLCSIYKVPDSPRFAPADADEKCVLCGLCAHACAGLGTGAISTVGRGIGKKVSTPYDEPSKDCIGCGSCAAVCPTGAIVCIEENGIRSIWNKKFELLRCESCGKIFATKEEFAYAQTRSESNDRRQICGECRRQKSADVFAAAFGIRKEI